MYIFNGRIYTMDPERPFVSALAVESGRIKAIGSDQEILGEFCGLMRGEDLKGKTVLPGLTDAHLHLEHYALSLQKINCETKTRAECIQRITDKASKVKPGEWILGHGWNQNNWEEGFGSAADLDRAAPYNPVYLTAKSLHAAWVNTAALKQARLDDHSPDPENGILGKDEKGHLNGILFESAMDLVANSMPEITTSQVAAAIQEAQETLWRVGITGVHDFDRKRCFQAIQLLRERGELRLRILKSIPLEDMPHAAALGVHTGFGDEWIKIGPVKIFADGALGPQTAAMLNPYEGSSDKLGSLFIDSEELFEHGRFAVENGLALAVHAIGDRANHVVLDGYAHLREYEHKISRHSSHSLRHRIEHVQLIHPGDAPRLAELGIIASMQPIHATSDMLMADRYWGERAKYSYAWNLQLNHGAVLAFGSDAPVESPNPFLGIHAAITRHRLDGSPSSQGWYPEQKISLQHAIEAFTTGAAYAAGWERTLGMLRKDYLADLILLEKDPFLSEPDELAEMKPIGTLIQGNWVHRA